MTEVDLTRTAQELIDAFNAGDWGRFRVTLTPDVVYEEAGTQRRTEGVDDYVQLCQGWKRAFPDAAGAVRRAIAGGGTVAQELTWTGTHRGPLEGPGGTIPASGRRIEVAASLWLSFQGDKAKEIHHQLDVLGRLQQVGAIPAPGQTGP